MVDSDVRGRVLRVRLQDSRSSAQHRFLAVGASPLRSQCSQERTVRLDMAQEAISLALGLAEGSTETCSPGQDHLVPRTPRSGVQGRGNLLS